MLLMRRACPLPEANNLQQKPLPTPVCKRQTSEHKVKYKPRENIFSMQKTANSRFLFFVVEVFILQKYKSKNNNDFLENAFIMSFSVFINAFFVQFGCINQNVHVAFASAVSLDIAHVVC